MQEIRVLSATGVLGSGFARASFDRGITKKPHFIGCDAGSTDPGPYYLGEGVCAFSRESVKRDLELMVEGVIKKKIPLIIGSCGTAGGDPNLKWTYEILKEIASRREYHFKVALIHSEQKRSYLLKKFDESKIYSLKYAPKIDTNTFKRAQRIVGMMGIEPIIKAFQSEAQIILCGRASDTSIFSALPIYWGINPGIVWHAAKILECGAAAVKNRIFPDSMISYLKKDHFIIEPLHPKMRCTPQSVAAHNLYENADPFYLTEPSGTIDTSEAEYTQQSYSAVRVKGSKFHPSKKYTIKLEAAELIGYQTIVIAGIRDPFVIRQFNFWLNSLKDVLKKRLEDIFNDEWYKLNVRVYGKNGVMSNLEPQKVITSHELGLIFEITASSQNIANSMASTTRHIALHHPIPEWSGSVSSVAFPYSPPTIERGRIYKFSLNHVVEPENPYEMFPIEFHYI